MAILSLAVRRRIVLICCVTKVLAVSILNVLGLAFGKQIFCGLPVTVKTATVPVLYPVYQKPALHPKANY